MSASNSTVARDAERGTHGVWDWVLLPALAIVTVCTILVATEFIARLVFPAHGDLKNCLVWNDHLTGVRGIPHCECDEKIPEGRPVTYQLNSCGDYTNVECGPKPPGVFRIVLMGTSFPAGVGVTREETFAGLLPKTLSQRTGHKVDLYNVSLPRKTPRVLDMDFDRILADKPDMILWVMNYSDVQLSDLVAPSDFVPENVAPPVTKKAGLSAPSALATLLALRKDAVAWGSIFAHRVNNSWRGTRSSVLLMHLMEVGESQRHFLARNRTVEGQYLSANPSPARLMHLKEFGRYVGDMIGRARAAGVPVVVTLAPTRVQAAMISNGSWQSDADPYSLDKELRAIIEGYGGIYIDTLSDYRTVPNAKDDFYPADGHFTPEGHEIYDNILANHLTSAVMSGLRIGNSSSTGLERSE